MKKLLAIVFITLAPQLSAMDHTSAITYLEANQATINHFLDQVNQQFGDNKPVKRLTLLTTIANLRRQQIGGNPTDIERTTFPDDVRNIVHYVATGKVAEPTSIPLKQYHADFRIWFLAQQALTDGTMPSITRLSEDKQKEFWHIVDNNANQSLTAATIEIMDSSKICLHVVELVQAYERLQQAAVAISIPRFLHRHTKTAPDDNDNDYSDCRIH